MLVDHRPYDAVRGSIACRVTPPRVHRRGDEAPAGDVLRPAFLDDRPRSVPEGELLAHVVFAGMPMPEVNETITLADGTALAPDLWFEYYEVAVEYEGGQHQDDRDQYVADIDRYAAYRRNRVDYELVTKELMRSPKAAVRGCTPPSWQGGTRVRRPTSRARGRCSSCASQTSYASSALREVQRRSRYDEGPGEAPRALVVVDQ